MSKMISALCMEHGIPLIKVDSSMKLGEWPGLGKYEGQSKEGHKVQLRRDPGLGGQGSRTRRSPGVSQPRDFGEPQDVSC